MFGMLWRHRCILATILMIGILSAGVRAESLATPGDVQAAQSSDVANSGRRAQAELVDAFAAAAIALVQRLRACATERDGIITVAIVADPTGRKIVSQPQVDAIADAIAGALSTDKTIRVKPLSEYSALAEFLSAANADDATFQDFLETNRDVDVLIRFRPLGLGNPEGGQIRVNVRLKAFTVNAACSEVERASLVLRADELRDVSAVLEDYAIKLLEDVPTQAFLVAPFRGRGGRSLCDDELRDRMIAALGRARMPLARGNSRPARMAAGAIDADPNQRQATSVPHQQDAPVAGDAAGTTRVTGSYAAIDDASTRFGLLDLKVRGVRDGQIVLQTDTRRVISPCDPTPFDFFREIKADAHTDAGKLYISPGKTPPFRVGDAAVFKIFTRSEQPLYCWYLSPERFAYILTPNPRAGGNMRGGRGRTLTFPDDFGMRRSDLPLGTASADLFGCFQPPYDISADDVHDQWTESWFGSGPSVVRVDEPEILKLLQAMREIPGMLEAYLDVIIQSRD